MSCSKLCKNPMRVARLGVEQDCGEGARIPTITLPELCSSPGSLRHQAARFVGPAIGGHDPGLLMLDLGEPVYCG